MRDVAVESSVPLAFLDIHRCDGGDARGDIVSQLVSVKSFGGSHTGDDVAHLLEPDRKPLPTLLKFGLREFDVRQWLFACQASLLFARGRALQVAEAGLVFVDEFTRILTARASQLPSGLPHSWVLSACVALTEALSFSSVDLMVDQSGAPAAADAALLQVNETEVYSLKGEPLARETASKTDVIILSWAPNTLL
jgi:hypothetical protein